MPSLRLLATTVFAAAGLPAHASTSPEEVCLQAYAGTFVQEDVKQSNLYTLGQTIRKVCSSKLSKSNASITGALKVIYEKSEALRQFAATYSASSDKRMCEFFEKYSLVEEAEFSVTRRASPSMASGLNQCLEIALGSRVAITHDVANPGLVAISFAIPSTASFELQGVEADGGFTCTMPVDGALAKVPSRPLKVSGNFVMTCKREGTRGPNGDIGYPSGVVLVGTNTGKSFSVAVEDATVLGPNSKREAQERIEAAEQRVARASERLKNARVTTHRYYFGANALPADFRAGQHFDCEFWRGKTAAAVEASVKSKLCPDADLFVIDKLGQHRGDKCGYSYYTIGCVTFPSS